MECQEVFNNILSDLEYDNISYDIVSEGGKTVAYIHCSDGTMKLTIKVEVRLWPTITKSVQRKNA